MTARKTQCLTWGERKTTCLPLLSPEGKRVGVLTLGQYITLCGREDDNPKDAGPFNERGPRPRGVCPRCWAAYKSALRAVRNDPNLVT